MARLYDKLNTFQKRELKYAIQNAIREKLGFYTNTYHADNKIALKGGRKGFFSSWNKLGGANSSDNPVSYTHLTLPTNREV